MQDLIQFQSVSKAYPVYQSARDRLVELVTWNRLRRHQDFWALREVSFTVQRGETFCLVGENGSGKSTTLQLIAGILQPTSGTVNVRGRIAALLELGSGFNPEFTGRDNVYLNASILGLSEAEIDAKYPAIERFAEIGDFIHQPVKTYSSGMAVRLAFSVAIHVDPEILLVDEALAVGDIYFRQRCLRKIHELRERGVTIIFVSHAASDVKAIGDRVLWLEHGRMRALGPAGEVIAQYLAYMAERDAQFLDTQGQTAAAVRIDAVEVLEGIPNVDHRHGDGRAEIIGIGLFTPTGERISALEPGQEVVLRISARAKEELHVPNIGFMLRNHLGVDFCGSNSLREGHSMPPLAPGSTVTVDFHLELPELYPGEFSFSPAIADGSLTAYRMCDWIDNALTVPMLRGEQDVYGYLHIPCRVRVNTPLQTPHPVMETHLG